jgi:hypothetical protein
MIDSNELKNRFTPKSIKDKIVLVFGAFCAIYILNPGFGLLEFLPDSLPIIGNLDEAAATAGLLYCLKYYGLDLGKWFRR